MSSGKNPFGGGGGKMPDLGALMKQAQKIQADVAKAQEELATLTCEASAGGGMVTVVINGQHELVSLKIDAAVVDPTERRVPGADADERAAMNSVKPWATSLAADHPTAGIANDGGRESDPLPEADHQD